MNKISRRSLASYAADSLQSGTSAKNIAKHLACVLVESDRAAELEFLVSDIAGQLERRGQLCVGRVTTATALSRDLQSDLKIEIKRVTSTRRVLLEQCIDQTILGGIKVETAARIWDLSLSRKLADLREAF